MPSMSTSSEPPSVWRGTYYDGVSARRQSVIVRAEAAGLAILSDDGATLAHWAAAGIRLVDGLPSVGPLRLANGARGDARLSVDDDSFRDWVRAKVPVPSRAAETARWAGIGAVATVLFAGALWFGVPMAARPIALWLPGNWLVATGEFLRNQIQYGPTVEGLPFEKPKVCSTPPGDAALARLQAGIGGSAAGGLPVTLTVVNWVMPNAFALPGGQIIVLRGLIDLAEGPEEVAGVLAHELGHVRFRHPAQRMVQTAGAALLIDTFIGGTGIISTLVSGAGGLAMLSFSRDMEREADGFAANRLADTGIGTAGLKRYFEKIRSMFGDDEESFGLMTYVSTHPSLSARIGELSDRGPAHKILSDADWKALKSICG
jgi:Zn-dependent protease with chaperone function